MSELGYVGVQFGISPNDAQQAVVYDDAALTLSGPEIEFVCRVYLYASGSQYGIVNYCNQIRISVDNDVITAEIKKGGSYVSLSAGVWNRSMNALVVAVQVASSANGYTYKLFINSFEFDSVEHADPVDSSASSVVHIGSDNTAKARMRGIISDVKAFSQPLDLDQRRMVTGARGNANSYSVSQKLHAYFPLNDYELIETQNGLTPADANKRKFCMPVETPSLRASSSGRMRLYNADENTEIVELTNYFVDFLIQRTNFTDGIVIDMAAFQIIWAFNQYELAVRVFTDDSMYRNPAEPGESGHAVDYLFEDPATGSPLSLEEGVPHRIGFGVVQEGFDNNTIYMLVDGQITTYATNVSHVLSLRQLYCGGAACCLLADLRVWGDFDSWIDLPDYVTSQPFSRQGRNLWEVLKFPLDLDDVAHLQGVTNESSAWFPNCAGYLSDVHIGAGFNTADDAYPSSDFQNPEIAAGTLKTYAPDGEVLFDGARKNVFLIDEFRLTTEQQISLPNVVTKVGCQLLPDRKTMWNEPSGFADARDDFEQPMSYSVDYSNGYPVIDFVYRGGETSNSKPHRVVVYSWGEPI